MADNEEKGYTEEEVREMTEGMIRGVFPDFTDEKVKEVVDGTAEQFKKEFVD